ncbi:MAG: DOMON domain-containing protein [Dehalococcoidia bacterium]|jgi:hypothetical protein
MFSLKSNYRRGLETTYLCIILAMLVIGLSACQAPQPAAPTQTPAVHTPAPATSQPIQVTATPARTAWIADGIISPGEYQNTQTYGDYTINWSNDDQYVYIGMQAKTMGWVAVGFGATIFMNNANIVQGYFNNGKAVVADQYSSGNFGPHDDITTLGGTYGILDSGGTQANGITIIEFKRKLAPGDKYHAALVKGTNKIIWACGGDNQYLIKHVSRGEGAITIQ